MKKHLVASSASLLCLQFPMIQSSAQEPKPDQLEPEAVTESIEDSDPNFELGVVPCGTYDPEELERHYLVEFVRSTTAIGKTKVEINTVAPSGPSDRRKVFPRERMALILRDEKNEVLLETPLLWRKRDPSPLDSLETYQLTVEFDPSLADRLCLSSLSSVVPSWPKHFEYIRVVFEPFHFRSPQD